MGICQIWIRLEESRAETFARADMSLTKVFLSRPSDSDMRQSAKTSLIQMMIFACLAPNFIWTNGELLFVEPLGTSLSEIWIKIEQFKKINLMSFPQCVSEWGFITPRLIHIDMLNCTLNHTSIWVRADSMLAPSQWEMSLQISAVSHWHGTNLESAVWVVALHKR